MGQAQANLREITLWQYEMIKNEKVMIVARCGTVEVRTVGGELDEVWKFASAIERSADELIIPLIGRETGRAKWRH